MSALAVYDPQLAAELPREALAGSAINGLDKGVEAVYTSTRTPITDATAPYGLGLLAGALGTTDDNDRRIHNDYSHCVPPSAAPVDSARREETRVIIMRPRRLGGRRGERSGSHWDFPARLRGVEGVGHDVPDDVAATAVEGFIGANDTPKTDRDPSDTDRDPPDTDRGTHRTDRDSPEPREIAHGWSGTSHPRPGVPVSKPTVRDVTESAW